MRIYSVRELYDKGFREFRVVHSGEAEAMQEEIAALRAEKLTDASALRLALERIAALEKVAEAAPELERVKYAWALYCGRGSKWDDAWREAGYLGGVE